MANTNQSINKRWYFNLIDKFSRNPLSKASIELFRNPLSKISILIGLVLMTFLWCFYIALVDRIFPTEHTVFQNTGIINPLAFKTVGSSFNILALSSPAIIFFIIGLVHRYWKSFWGKCILPLIIVVSHIIMGLVSKKEIYWHLPDRPLDFMHVLLIVIWGPGVLFAVGVLHHIRKGTSDNIDNDTDVEE